MRDARILFPLLMLSCAGCVRMNDIYAPPIERQPILGVAPYLDEYIEVRSPNFTNYVVRDVMSGNPGDFHRWTSQQPTLRFVPRRARNRRLQVDFAVAEATLKETGPITITFKVNGHALDSIRYDAHGEKRFEKPVPAEWIVPNSLATVSMEIDKVWVSKDDGARLGVLLLRAGFRP